MPNTYHQRFKSPEQRFWEKVEKTETCWLWTGTLDRDGYANRFALDGTTWAPHRLSYTWANGPIPAASPDDQQHR